MNLIIFDLDDTLYDKSGQIGEDINKIESIKPFEDAIEILKYPGFLKVLVSLAKNGEEIQMKKLKVLGILSYFDKILFCKDKEGKKRLFEMVLNEYKIKPKETFVIGDRIDSEIRYGNMLGCITVFFKRNKWKYANLVPKDKFELATYTIYSLQEIIPLLHEHRV